MLWRVVEANPEHEICVEGKREMRELPSQEVKKNEWGEPLGEDHSDVQKKDVTNFSEPRSFSNRILHGIF